MLEQVRAGVKGYLAALPVPYRTCGAQPTFQSLREADGQEGPEGRAVFQGTARRAFTIRRSLRKTATVVTCHKSHRTTLVRSFRMT